MEDGTVSGCSHELDTVRRRRKRRRRRRGMATLSHLVPRAGSKRANLCTIFTPTANSTHLANLCRIPDIAFNCSISDTEQVSHLGGGSEDACRQVRRVEQLRGVSPPRTVPVVPPRVIFGTGWCSSAAQVTLGAPGVPVCWNRCRHRLS